MNDRVLMQQLERILRRYPSGLSEFELLKLLQVELHERFPESLFKDNYALYQAHFLLFHALYALDEALLERTGEGVQVGVLRTMLISASKSGSDLPASPDPLRAYYRDLNNLEATGPEEVEALLGRFWGRYLANERRCEALQVLGLSDPVDDATITRRFRELAMRHHPDRGGEQEVFQSLQEAVQLLRRC